MKSYIILVLFFIGTAVNAQIKTLNPGQEAPVFKLKNVDDKLISFADYPSAKGFIIVFTCNTCPVAQAYEQRIIELDHKFKSKGYPVIAINPNDPAASQGDSFSAMKIRAELKKYNFPYLFDPNQKVTNLYGATKTPHLFLAQKTKNGIIIQYTGAIDDDPENSIPQKTDYVEDAIGALNASETPTVTSTKAIGCTVKRATK